MDCIFCKISKKEIPTEVVYEDDLVMAFYCGVRSIADFKGDVEMSGLDGLYGYSDLSSMEKVINRAITNCKKRGGGA